MTQNRAQPIGEILNDLMARRGYARVLSSEAVAAAWRQSAGDSLTKYTNSGAIRRGVLEITVANSTLVQELTYQKTNLLESLRRLLPDQSIRDLRFKVGAVC